MRHNGVEYRILRGGTGKLFKVEICQDYFMGVKQWRTLSIKHTFFGTVYYADEIFRSCKEAKTAAILSIERRNPHWTECKC